jgi:hypothetical protein
MLLRTLLPLTLFVLGFVLVKDVKASGKHSPFTVDEESITATLSIKGSVLVEKYRAVFERHGRNSASTVDWVGVIEMIVGMKDTDLYISGELTFESNDETVEISSTSKETLVQLLDVVHPVLSTPQRVDAFLTEQDALLKKTKK